MKNCGHAYQGQIKKDGATTALPLSSPLSPPKSSRLHSDRAGRERSHSYALTPFCSWLQLTTRPPGRAWHGSPYHGYKKTAREKKEGRSARQERKKRAQERGKNMRPSSSSNKFYYFGFQRSFFFYRCHWTSGDLRYTVKAGSSAAKLGRSRSIKADSTEWLHVLSALALLLLPSLEAESQFSLYTSDHRCIGLICAYS